MKNLTKPNTILIIAGLGPGSNDLVTPEALNEARTSDIIIVPRSRENERGMAESLIAHHLPEKILTPVLFPMTRNEEARNKIILSQLEALRPELEASRKIFFPVIGDSMLYSTGAYLIEMMTEIMGSVETRFIPGISAHSLAAACAKRFTAMSDEIFSIIPGTAAPEKISSVLAHSDSAAIYKPTALKDIHSLISPSSFSRIIRVDFAGIPGKERIIEGNEALENIDEYMSIILLWR